MILYIIFLLKTTHIYLILFPINFVNTTHNVLGI